MVMLHGLQFLRRLIVSKNDTENFQKEMVLSKYISDLELLEQGRTNISENMNHSGINNEIINKKLHKLDKSIDKLRNLIDDFKQTI